MLWLFLTNGMLSRMPVRTRGQASELGYDSMPQLIFIRSVVSCYEMQDQIVKD